MLPSGHVYLDSEQMTRPRFSWRSTDSLQYIDDRTEITALKEIYQSIRVDALIVRAYFDIHLHGNRLVYLKEPCAAHEYCAKLLCAPLLRRP